jgi:DeoR/GlpR family transcriptional regulator of sugar metabolism
MNQRQKQILERLEQQGACTYHELAALFKVSAMTIRRDVDELANLGAATKTLGGVQKALVPAFMCETELHARLNEQKEEKQAIAAQALGLLAGNSTIFIDGGTTCWEFARALSKKAQGLTVVTNSALITLEVGQGQANSVIGIGGDYDPDRMSFVGPATEDAAARYFLDIAFFSTKGFMPAEGTFESAAPNFRIKQIIARQAKKVVLLADHTKFGQRALCKVFNTAQIHVIVTDSQTPAASLAILRDAGHEVLVAPPRREVTGRHENGQTRPMEAALG